MIATAAAFIVGCSLGLMGGIVFMRLAAPGPPWGFMREIRRGEGPPRFGFGRPGEPGRRGGPGGPGRDDRMLPMLERELELTPAQRERIVTELDRARRAHAAVRESTQAWIERELTAVQREQWKQMEARFERARRRGGTRALPPPDRP